MEDNYYIENPEVSTENVTAQKNLIKMTFWQGIKAAFANTFDYKGRARRKEYWSFYVFMTVILVLSWIVAFVLKDLSQTVGLVSKFFLIPGFLSIAFLLPYISVLIRRFHDIGRNCVLPIIFIIWPIVLSIVILIIGPVNFMIQSIFSFLNILIAIIMLVFSFQNGDPNDNIYGKSPKYEE